MKVECAWCGKNLGEKEPVEDTGITHGMCPACRETERKTGEFELAIKRDPARYSVVRNSHRQLTEVIDKDTGRINQKSLSGWYWVD